MIWLVDDPLAATGQEAAPGETPAGRLGPPPAAGDFLSGQNAPERLRLPETLYGREREIAALAAAFERVRQGGRPELLLLAGHSGIGKSSLVRELQRALAEPQGIFLAGKFEQSRRDIPYDTPLRACRDLVRRLLCRNAAEIAGWRQALRAALGDEGRRLLEFLPELEAIAGPQPSLPPVPPQEAEGRFLGLLCRFLGVFARSGRPLVFFLDDLQWLDAASRKLVESLLVHPEVRHLLLVGAYRDDEVGLAHPLLLALENLARAGVPLETVVLAPLSRRQVGDWLAAALQRPPGEIRPLARLIHDKTGGNPFFCGQFLAALAESGLLAYDPGRGAWQWNAERIGAEGFAGDVAEFMLGKLQRLPAATREALHFLACLGAGGEAATLGLVRGETAAEAHSRLGPAVRAGLLLRSGDKYRFAHDRIQEAAYALAAADALPARHLDIARRLRAGWPAATAAERLFELAGHFNRGAALIESREERERVAALNLQAGQRARAAAACAAAAHYFAAGQALLPPDTWESDYGLAFDLQLGRAGCEWLRGDFATAAALLAELEARARDCASQAEVYRLRISIDITQGEIGAAVDTALAAWERWFGAALPRHPEPAAVAAALTGVLAALEGRAIEDLAGLPTMADAGLRAAAAMVSAALPAMYFTDPRLHDLACCHVARWSLAGGNTESSCHAYVTVGAGLGHLFGDWDGAWRFGRLACRLADSYGPGPWRSTSRFVAAFLIDGWVRPLRELPAAYREALLAASQCGDLNTACYAASNLVASRLLLGEPLAEVAAEARRQLDFLGGSKYEAFTLLVGEVLRFVRRLAGEEAAAASGSAGEAAAFPSFLSRETCRFLTDFLVGDPAAAAQAALRLQGHLADAGGNLLGADYAFYSALAFAADHDRAPPERQAEYRRLLAAREALWRDWQARCPENFRHMHALVAAELARLEGRPLEAMQFFEQAVEGARANGFVQHEAIAWERAAAFRRGRGFNAGADACLREAHACYGRWGAKAKAEALAAAHPALFPAAASGRGPLDALAIAKASQAISGEIVLDRLVETLLTIAVEHAGADRGLLVLPRGGTLAVAAEVAVAGERIEVRLQPAPPLPEALPASVLHYVARSRESLILDDAPLSDPHGADPYVRRCRPRSLLCLPLVRQRELVGLLYLENRQAPHAFTRERLALLELLAAQAAISLENARLYADLQQENAERSRAEAALRESRELLQAIIDNSTAVIFVKDLEGRYLLVNRRYQELFHVSNEAMLGRSDYDLFAADLADLLRAADRRVLAANATLEFEETIPQDDGLHTYLALKFPLHDGGGRVYAVCGIATDISERLAAEAERQARQAAEAASRAKSVFLASMSHELRTPLNAILGYTQLLRREPGLSERQAGGLDTIRQSGLHLLTLINDILDLAKIEAGKFELQPAPLDLAACLAVVVDIIRLRVEEKGLRFACAVPPQLPAAVLADDRRLRQVLLNLLANAVNFTERGEVALRVTETGRGQDRLRLRFEVSDTGAGIETGQLGRIFQPFEQAGESGRRAGGTGLGLAISRQLIRSMGSDIEVESEPGRGSRFRFELALPVLADFCGRAEVGAALPGGRPPAAVAAAADPALLLPPRAEMEALHRLAMAGNMRDIRDWTENLAHRDERYRPFAEHLRGLALAYQSKAILALVEEKLADTH